MHKEKLKVLILTHGGVERLLELLTGSETAAAEVVGVFVEEARAPSRSFREKFERSVRYDGWLETFKKFAKKIPAGASANGADTESAERKSFEEIARRAGVPVIRVDDYHSEETKKLLREANADLGILYGTNIIKKSVFEIPKLGSINIHQGLAPLYRGGPTVFWELFNGETEIGITVHFVAPKVDTGDIVRQETLPLEYDFEKYGLDFEKFLKDFRETLKEPSARLLAEAVEQIASGNERRVKQNTSIGKRYRLPTKAEKDELRRILRRRRGEMGKVERLKS